MAAKSPDELVELLHRKEELLPELKACVVDIGVLGPCLKHPLYFAVPYTPEMNAIYNESYQVKSTAVAKAKRESNWSGYIFYHERPYRLQVFGEVEKEMPDEDYWELLRDIWTDSENIWQNKDAWRKYLSSSRPGSFMDVDDRVAFDKLPDQFWVYRGYLMGKNKSGFSYTLDDKKALWFSKRFARTGDVARMHSRLVKKSQVFAYTNARDEQEVIILPRRGWK
jgi:hypothetical protein